MMDSLYYNHSDIQSLTLGQSSHYQSRYNPHHKGIYPFYRIPVVVYRVIPLLTYRYNKQSL